MHKISHNVLFGLCFFWAISCSGSHDNSIASQTASRASATENPSTGQELILGVDRTEAYMKHLKGKRVGVVANQTSIKGNKHIVDFLLAEGVAVVTVFAPEHGFRGEAGPGDKVVSGKDPKTGLPVISLYGTKRRPSKEDLSGLDVVLFDIQDVGVRFYTYISTLHYMMEECGLYGIPVVVLDRPNPNGFYVDGPVLESEFSSFVGVAPIPIVHGLTVGEYASMAVGEGWLKDGRRCVLHVVPMENYTHSTKYVIPVAPSPNLQNMDAILLYPSLCLFEGAAVSVGRGTPYPFTWMGFPGYKGGTSELTPNEIAGVIKNPPYEGKVCSGRDMSVEVASVLRDKRLKIEWVVEMYQAFPDKKSFFNPFFEKLAGTDKLRKQIESGISADSIRDSWQPALTHYKKAREKYLIYKD